MVFRVVAWDTGQISSHPVVSSTLFKHMALALVGLWQCDTVDLPGLPVFIF